MNILFLTLLDVSDINQRGIYHDLLRQFRNEGHNVYIVSASERRNKKKTQKYLSDGVTMLKVWTLNIQKSSLLEKGLGTLLMELQFFKAIKKYLKGIRFDVVLYSTPPITYSRVVRYIKKRDGARSYLLLKDIFPQNAIDLGMLKKGGVLHRMFEKKERELYRISDHIGCMSPANVKYILANNTWLEAGKVEVNPNSIMPIEVQVDAAKRLSIRQKFNIPANDVVFIYGGNLGKPQGIDFLLTVLKSNINKKGCFFIVVGSGTEFSLLDDWFSKNKPANMMLRQVLPKNEYDELLSACDVGLIFLDKRFTIPNFPSRLLSYLECRLPVIAATDRNTDIGQTIEAANCGFGVESGDLSAFLSAQNRLISEPGLAASMGENGYRLLKTSYTVQVSYQLIMDKLNS